MITRTSNGIYQVLMAIRCILTAAPSPNLPSWPFKVRGVQTVWTKAAYWTMYYREFDGAIDVYGLSYEYSGTLEKATAAVQKMERDLGTSFPMVIATYDPQARPQCRVAPGTDS